MVAGCRLREPRRDEHQHARPIGGDFRTAGANRASEAALTSASPQVLALKEKRRKHGSGSLAAERQTTGHEVVGDTEPTLPVQAVRREVARSE